MGKPPASTASIIARAPVFSVGARLVAWIVWPVTARRWRPAWDAVLYSRRHAAELLFPAQSERPRSRSPLHSPKGLAGARIASPMLSCTPVDLLRAGECAMALY